MRILFITSTRIGDAILSTGLLSHLVKSNPSAQLTIACGPACAGLFRSVPGLERLIVMRKKKYNGHWVELFKECRKTKWDLIVDLRDSIVSRLLKADRRAYCSKSMKGHHKVEENASALGLTPPPAPVIWMDQTAIRAADRIMAECGESPLALGPSANWPAKQWSSYNFLALAEKLTAENGPMPNSKILVIAAENERDQIAPLLQTLPPEQVISAVGQDLLTVAACMKKCRLFVGNDSGLTHLSAAVGTPTLGLFGPGYEKIYGPWGDHAAFVRTEESTSELLKRLPSPGAFYPNLMGGLSVDKVYQSAIELILKTA